MGKALYRKYRSKSLAEVVGQEHITRTLETALKNGQISHAYLFTGPKGVGKTSIARILAHAVNGLPYDGETNHIDIIEIDAASNRRIEEIRDLREKIHVTPTSAKYKIYIIDEVHMLTREAFNALLKTLEEPPAHTIFILATTEAHKLPDTIVSRTQRFNFKPIGPEQQITHLKTIADKEKINISNDALQLIAQHSSGSFRDSISLLDQASNLGKKIELKDVEELLGIAPEQAIDNLETALGKSSVEELVLVLQDLKEHGFQATSIAKQLAARLRQELLTGNSSALTPHEITSLLGKLLQVPSAHDPDSFLELIFISLVVGHGHLSRAAKVLTKDLPTEKPKNATTPQDTALPVPKQEVKQTTRTYDSAQQAWPSVLQVLKQRHNTLYSVVRMAEPVWEGNNLTLKFAFPFHQKRLEESKNKQLLLDIFFEVSRQNIKLISVVDKKVEVPAPPVEANAGEHLDTISNIFGNAELID